MKVMHHLPCPTSASIVVVIYDIVNGIGAKHEVPSWDGDGFTIRDLSLAYPVSAETGIDMLIEEYGSNVSIVFYQNGKDITDPRIFIEDLDIDA